MGGFARCRVKLYKHHCGYTHSISTMYWFLLCWQTVLDYKTCLMTVLLMYVCHLAAVGGVHSMDQTLFLYNTYLWLFTMNCTYSSCFFTIIWHRHSNLVITPAHSASFHSAFVFQPMSKWPFKWLLFRNVIFSIIFSHLFLVQAWRFQCSAPCWFYLRHF